MGIAFRNRFVAFTAGAVLAACAPVLLSGTAAARSAGAAVRPGAATARSAAAAGRPHAAARSREPWLAGDTAGRGLRWVHRGTVEDAVGKIFLTLGHTGYECSGVLVRGGPAPVVLTAAHCASQHGRTAAGWTFVPGYADGRAPFGRYTARRFYVSPRWTTPGPNAERYDVAFVRVARATSPRGAATARTPRGLPIRFAKSQADTELTRAYVFGYPAQAPFSGQYANYCAGPAGTASGVLAQAGDGGPPRRGSMRTACGMTAGDSGGPWLAGFRPRAGTGTVRAVTAFKLSGYPRVLYGTVLGPSARALYLAATGRRRVSRER